MSEVSPIKPISSSSVAHRRESLSKRIRKSGCRSWRIRNSMQELLAITYLNRMGREARAEVLGRLSASEKVSAREAPAVSDIRNKDAGPAEAFSAEKTLAETTSSLFEKSLRTTGRVVSEQT